VSGDRVMVGRRNERRGHRARGQIECRIGTSRHKSGLAKQHGAVSAPNAAYVLALRLGRLTKVGMDAENCMYSNQRIAVPKTSRPRRSRRPLVFTRRNYILMVVGVLAVVLGYALMGIENALDGFISLYLAPIIILGGYLEIIYAILWKPDEKAASASSSPSAQ